jgi:hypothetical protein
MPLARAGSSSPPAGRSACWPAPSAHRDAQRREPGRLLTGFHSFRASRRARPQSHRPPPGPHAPVRFLSRSRTPQGSQRLCGMLRTQTAARSRKNSRTFQDEAQSQPLSRDASPKPRKNPRPHRRKMDQEPKKEIKNAPPRQPPAERGPATTVNRHRGRSPRASSCRAPAGNLSRPARARLPPLPPFLLPSASSAGYMLHVPAARCLAAELSIAAFPEPTQLQEKTKNPTNFQEIKEFPPQEPKKREAGEEEKKNLPAGSRRINSRREPRRRPRTPPR